MAYWTEEQKEVARQRLAIVGIPFDIVDGPQYPDDFTSPTSRTWAGWSDTKGKRWLIRAIERQLHVDFGTLPDYEAFLDEVQAWRDSLGITEAFE